jgi:hypothetical protein
MIQNVIDRRTRHYRWRQVHAIIEATAHDNACEDADQQPPGDDELVYEEIENVTLQEAIEWANGRPSPVTLYLYDKGAGTT